MPLGDKTSNNQPAELQNPVNVTANQNQIQTENLNQNRSQGALQLSPEEMEEVKALNLQTQARREAQRQARERRESRIQAVRQGCQIIMPTVAFTTKGVSVQGETYARKSKESISAGKRKTRQGWKISALHQKEENARLAEASGDAWEATLTENRRKLLDSRPPQERAALEARVQKIGVFLTGNQAKDEELLRLSENQEDMARVCKNRFMEMNLNFDLRTDRSFAQASPELEGVAQKVREMKRLLKQFPQIRESLSEDDRIDFDAKLEVAQDLANYYAIRKKVVTNARYRSHYNSEISYRYHESDTLEAKNLTMLLWQAENLKNKQGLSPSAEFLTRFQAYRETTQDKGEAEETRAFKAILGEQESESGKNDPRIEDSRHAAYFRELVGREDDAVVQRLERTNYYQVAGEQEAMGESFVRRMANLPRWRAVQHADPEYVRSMVENLAREPQNVNDTEEVESCRQANLKGMGQFKDLLKKQMNYLKRKYGNGLILLSPEELVQHGHEFKNDFTNMQGLERFIDYLKRLPGMFDPQDESDVEMERLYNYYLRCVAIDTVEKSGVRGQSTGSQTYSDYKRRVALGIVEEERSAETVIQLSDTMHLDIRWGVAFDEADVKGAEIPAALSQQDMRERIKERTGEAGMAGGPDWHQMFPETEHLSREEAAKRFVEKDAKERLEGKSIRELFQAAAKTMGGMPEDVLDREAEAYEAYVTRREEYRRGWEERHPGEDVPELPLTGTERSMRATLEMYRLYAHYETALDIRRQALQEAERLGDQGDLALRRMYEHLAEDLLQAAEHYSKERGKVQL